MHVLVPNDHETRAHIAQHSGDEYQHVQHRQQDDGALADVPLPQPLLQALHFVEVVRLVQSGVPAAPAAPAAAPVGHVQSRAGEYGKVGGLRRPRRPGNVGEVRR